MFSSFSTPPKKNKKFQSTNEADGISGLEIGRGFQGATYFLDSVSRLGGHNIIMINSI
jgi:hypothetical protein